MKPLNSLLENKDAQDKLLDDETKAKAEKEKQEQEAHLKDVMNKYRNALSKTFTQIQGE